MLTCGCDEHFKFAVSITNYGGPLKKCCCLVWIHYRRYFSNKSCSDCHVL